MRPNSNANETAPQLRIALGAKYIHVRLLASGVTISQTGKNIRDCDYDELKYELVLASFREIDQDNDSGKWF